MSIKHKRFRVTKTIESNDPAEVDLIEEGYLDSLSDRDWEVIQSDVTVQEVYPEGEITSYTPTTFELSLNVLARTTVFCG